MDFFGGSGTTGVVAHKLNRRYIMCEQLESQFAIQKERLSTVVTGRDPGSLAVELNWQGGGSFVCCELAQLNQQHVDAIEDAKTDEELVLLLNNILSSGFISSYVSPKEINAEFADFKALPMEDKKRLLMALLDKNMLYVNYCDMNDETFAVAEVDKAFTSSFYGEA